jgi:hypothetical protein
VTAVPLIGIDIGGTTMLMLAITARDRRTERVPTGPGRTPCPSSGDDARSHHRRMGRCWSRSAQRAMRSTG